MALWGQGDPRWIVEERPDSTNVNNWHWTERDGTSWSKEKLKKLFLSVSHESDEGSWRINEVVKIEGEATLNNRKGKLICFYEWDLKMKFTGNVVGSDLNHSGNIHIPNLSDENSADDVDIEITAKDDSKNSEALKQLVRKDGIRLCREMCQQYLADLKQEYATGMVLPTKKDVTTNGQKGIVNNSSKVNERVDMKKLNIKDNKQAKHTSCHVSLSLTEEFKTTANELFATLTLPERLSAFTRSKCFSNPVVGGEFSIMDGNISGSYTEMVENKKIVEKWRFKDWPSDVHSIVTIEIEQKSDCTILKLLQTGVPDYDIVKTEEGWKRHFWGPIKQVFGFGAQLF